MGTRASSYELLLRVITRYYLLLHYMERKRLLGEISKNFWEFDWVRAHHLMTCYCPLLRVITRNYLLLHYEERKRLLGEISKNFWEFDWVRAHHLMNSYYALLHVITSYYIIWREKDYSVKFLRISGNLIGYARIIL